ncbi:MAG TPA: response regulator [Longimicrobiaceae bacterium]|nr:response regulator [Longimicrobiaceae bacterium]
MSSGSGSGRSPLILVVDDNPLNVEPLCDLLEAMGYRVAEAYNGAEALQAVQESPPDLILLDIMMPGMNGFEVCRRLKADPRSAKIPVVFVTALADTEDKVAGIDAGGDDFLTKPFNRPLLLARIRSLLRLKAANDELESSYRKLQALERMKDDLMKMIVHDLKSPLSAILATLEMTLDRDLGALTAEQERMLADAFRRGDEMVQLVDDLLEMSQLEDSRVALQLAELDAADLLQEVAAEWSVRTDQVGASLAVEEAPALRFAGDQHLLRRVFSNLIGNALKHAGDGVQIRCRARAEPFDGREGVHFTVSDNGVGIPEEYHEMIFRKFASARRWETESAFRSSGLGLTFCKLAVEAHGGHIWVQSRPGEGSAFHFVLPLTPVEAQPAVAA